MSNKKKEQTDSIIVYLVVAFIIFISIDALSADAAAAKPGETWGDGHRNTVLWQQLDKRGIAGRIEALADVLER